VLHQWGLIRGKDRVEQIKKKRGKIIHKISTDKGQSGSAIFLIDKERNFSIVGVHKGEVDRKDCNNEIRKFNVGRLLTEELINKL
jgi:V8-like Glu-specific endopeptidase